MLEVGAREGWVGVGGGGQLISIKAWLIFHPCDDAGGRSAVRDGRRERNGTERKGTGSAGEGYNLAILFWLNFNLSFGHVES